MTGIDGSRSTLWEFASVVATAESADALVSAACGACGELRRLDLDPRLFQFRDPDGLAESVRAAVLDAAGAAALRAFEAGREFLGADARPGTVDFVLDPVLHELDRLIAADGAPRPGNDDRSRPKLGAGIDYRAVRERLAAVREQVAALEEEAESGDGLISATVDGRGRLRELWLHERVYRVTDSRALAQQVRATVRAAADAAGERRRALTRSGWT